MSLIMDGMDQSATNLSHQKKIRKSTFVASLNALKSSNNTKHGSERFLDFLQYPHEANLTINVLLHLLVRRFRTHQKLYKQMDNSGKKNKRSFVFRHSWSKKDVVNKEVCYVSYVILPNN